MYLCMCMCERAFLFSFVNALIRFALNEQINGHFTVAEDRRTLESFSVTSTCNDARAYVTIPATSLHSFVGDSDSYASDRTLYVPTGVTSVNVGLTWSDGLGGGVVVTPPASTTIKPTTQAPITQAASTTPASTTRAPTTHPATSTQKPTTVAPVKTTAAVTKTQIAPTLTHPITTLPYSGANGVDVGVLSLLSFAIALVLAALFM